MAPYEILVHVDAQSDPSRNRDRTVMIQRQHATTDTAREPALRDVELDEDRIAKCRDQLQTVARQ